jgi:hypothetical protein
MSEIEGVGACGQNAVRWFHNWHHWFSHQWEFVNLRHMLAIESKSQYTLLLYVCRTCGEVETRELSAHWTLDEVRNRKP